MLIRSFRDINKFEEILKAIRTSKKNLSSYIL